MYSRYGGRGIKFAITLEEVNELWRRDTADKMRKPSIDRKDVNGDYTFMNCQFIEWAENLIKDQWILDKHQDFVSGHRGRMNRYEKRQKDRGLCTRCTEPRITKNHCSKHAARANELSREQKKKRYMRGVCEKCVLPRVQDKHYCQKHIDYAKEQNRKKHDSRP